MPAKEDLKHRRAHNVLLIQKLMGARENASPFTLVLDSLEQSGRPLVKEIAKRATKARTYVVFVSFETVRKPTSADVFILAHELNLLDLQKRLQKAVSPSSRTLVIFDSLHPLLNNASVHVSSFFAPLMALNCSIVATYHMDAPVTGSNPSCYSPQPLAVLRYLATAILTVHSLHHVLAQKAARDRAEPEPLFGLGGEGIEGALLSLGSNDTGGLVIEMEYRRKSGRSVGEWFVLSSPGSAVASAGAKETRKAGVARGGDGGTEVILLEDHPLYTQPSEEVVEKGLESTFNLELTEKQRRDREGVVLPYFDAQDGAGGEGGRILYEMGVEDDFDEEEDEI
ncbi:uncharacterized protein PV09_09192 [Verruconis gallopava]|uniref:Elongator complex protein 5 n=1 Tax=Verruconis gallopava TaxID=253628 RepID=A0A0D2AJI5_9PEZI|nr:uncharacterized protein PV09_09192 [Verruconis gallopava]KIV99088.1 hypothetical protein PV09_09192 [Verruconis gallopava]